MTLGQKAREYYTNGFNCAAATLLAAGEIYDLGLKKDNARFITAFGGGIGCGHICGALAGAESALGMVLLPQDTFGSPEFRDICAAFVAKFREKWGSEMCEKARAAHAHPETHCADLVKETGDMLQQYIDEILAKR